MPRRAQVQPFQKTLTMANLVHLDNGQVAMLADHQFKRAIQDCEDRPYQPKARKVTIELEFVPRLDEQANSRGVVEMLGVDMTAKVKATVPSLASAGYPMLIAGDGVAVFSPGDPSNPLQAPLPFDPETGEVTDDAETTPPAQ
ncbi:MAG: hypothetical protein AAF078_13810 [Planctomycetota bacterium]